LKAVLKNPVNFCVSHYISGLTPPVDVIVIADFNDISRFSVWK